MFYVETNRFIVIEDCGIRNSIIGVNFSVAPVILSRTKQCLFWMCILSCKTLNLKNTNTVYELNIDKKMPTANAHCATVGRKKNSVLVISDKKYD